MDTMEGNLRSASDAKNFILAGNAYFTFRQNGGVRYTYRVSRAKCSRCRGTKCSCWKYPNYFVNVLTGADNQEDYAYIGMIGDQQTFKATKKTVESGRDQWPSFKAFEVIWNGIVENRIPEKLEIWHEGRCGCCGRKLTVPESIAKGIGPKCEQ